MRFTQINYLHLFIKKNYLKKSNYTDVVKARLLSYEDHKKYLKDVRKKI